MSIRDYLIERSGKDWKNLLADWAEVLPREFTVWLVNRFGDLFIVLEDGSVHMLDVGKGTLRRMADDRDKFCDELDRDDNAADWLMTGFVDQCVAAGLVLGPNQCDGYKLPPLFGGEYTIANVFPIDLREHYSVLGDMHRQTKDLPDGTRVKLVVTNLQSER